MKKVVFRTIGAIANRSGAMEAGDHLINGAGTKNRMSRGNNDGTVYTCAYL